MGLDAVEQFCLFPVSHDKVLSYRWNNFLCRLPRKARLPGHGAFSSYR
jgi:hypothetical protein